MKAEEIKEVLRQGIVAFTYLKKDGSLREAKGTLNTNIISDAGATPQGGGNYSKEAGYIPYYDVDKAGWRCFDPDQFQLVERQNSINEEVH